MSQYPAMYPTQLSYLPQAGMYATAAYPANYCMLPAMYGSSAAGLNMSSQHSVASTLTSTPSAASAAAGVTGEQENKEAVMTVSSSVADYIPSVCDNTSNVSLIADDKTEYLEELNKEKENLEQKDNSHAKRLIDREISLVQSGHSSLPTACETQMVDVYREKPIRLVVKVTVPVKEHPKFNFVGKLLGPKGNSLKRLQEETLTKMAVLGKGSMRDKAKEEEMRLGKDPKYHHLNEELHVEIVAFAPPAEAHARMSYALTEVRKYLIPDSNDTIRQLQMKELEILNSSEKMLTDPAQLQLLKTVTPGLQSMTPLLVPSTASYLSQPHMSLLPTPPLDTPTITAPPTKYEMTEQSSETLKMTENKRGERRRETQPY